jgi:hypothetical protein
MKKPEVIAGIAAIAALTIAGIAFAAMSGNKDDGKAGDSGGGVAAGSCPAADVPGISDEERERCFGLDSPGGNVGAGGGAAGNSCPSADVPGISDEERERCFGADSGGNGGMPPEEPTVSPDQPVSTTPGGSVTTGPSKLPELSADRRAVEAPIDGLDVAVLESFPPQYMLTAHAGLPNGCAQRYGSEVARDGDVITVTVLNSMPAIQNMACTMIYGMYEVNLNLGGDFEPGVTYTVKVNDQETTFTAQ